MSLVAMINIADIEMSKIQDFSFTQSHTVSAHVDGFASRSYSMGATGGVDYRVLTLCCGNRPTMLFNFCIYVIWRSLPFKF